MGPEPRYHHRYSERAKIARTGLIWTSVGESPPEFGAMMLFANGGRHGSIHKRLVARNAGPGSGSWQRWLRRVRHGESTRPSQGRRRWSDDGGKDERNG